MNTLKQLKETIMRDEWNQKAENFWRIHDLLICTKEVSDEYLKSERNSFSCDDTLVTSHALEVSALLEQIKSCSKHVINRSEGLVDMVNVLYECVKPEYCKTAILLQIIDAAIEIDARFENIAVVK